MSQESVACHSGKTSCATAMPLEIWSHKEVCNVILILSLEYVFSIKIPHHLIVVYGDSIMRMQHDRK
jgi:hypothetical protein